jgi:hypothetical protein
MGAPGDVVGEDMVHKALGVGALDAHLAHVRDVEHTAGLAHGIVLVDDRGILDGHVETSERRDEGAQCHMFVVETGSLFSIISI